MPTPPRYVDAGTNFIAILWTEVETAMTYRVEYNVMSLTTTLNLTTSIENANITGLMAGTVYEIRVIAVNGDLESMPSNTTIQITSNFSKFF